MIAAINPITVSQEIAEISNSTRVFIAHAAAVRCRILMSVAPLRNTGEIADSKFSHRVALRRREKFLKSRRPTVERNMGESSSKRFGVFQTAVVLAYGGLTACSALPEE